MKIPNICIFIPGVHSRTVFAPRYTLDLYKRMWNPMMDDPTQTVREIKFPKGITPQFKVREVLSLEHEKQFWSEHFKDKALFDSVWPGRTFEQEFEAMLEKMADAVPTEDEEEEKPIVPEEISALEGVTPEMAQNLVRGGFKALASISRASLADLMEVEDMNAPLAKALREAALAAVGDGELVVTETGE